MDVPAVIYAFYIAPSLQAAIVADMILKSTAVQIESLMRQIHELAAGTDKLEGYDFLQVVSKATTKQVTKLHGSLDEAIKMYMHRLEVLKPACKDDVPLLVGACISIESKHQEYAAVCMLLSTASHKQAEGKLVMLLLCFLSVGVLVIRMC